MDLNNRGTDKDTTKPRTLGLFGHSVQGIQRMFRYLRDTRTCI